jgi:uncharacterized protein YndB with AHSA1/START domain
MAEHATDIPIRKSITVKASQQRAFEVFTEGLDTWWPREHHIGKSPMKTCLLEGRVGGRCYTEQVDGTEADWGSILAWDPPQRFVMAWQVSTAWQFEPDLAKSSEVEVRFTPLAGGLTRVDLEHRHLSRHGAGFEALRTVFDAPDGWNGLLTLFAATAEAP